MTPGDGKIDSDTILRILRSVGHEAEGLDIIGVINKDGILMII